MFRVAKRKVMPATGRQRKLRRIFHACEKIWMFNNVYEHTPWKFTTLRDGTARFCRECKFVSCYLHKVERRHNRFRRAPDEKGSLVFKTFKICNVDGTAITSYRYRATQLRVLINAIILFKKYIFLLTRYQWRILRYILFLFVLNYR